MYHTYKKLIWLVVLIIMLSACDAVEATPTPGPASCPPENNAYTTQISSDVNAIYELGVKSAGNSTDYENVQLQALNELVNHVYYLSDSVEIPLGEKTARITITYVSPELVHIITVNHYLSNRYLNFSGKLNEQIQAHIARIIERNEYVFFITFTASVYTVDQTSTFDFQLDTLELTNTNNAKVVPAHEDRVLTKRIDLTDGPKYGFFYYPMAIIQNGNCQTVLDKNYDTNVELSISNIVINEKYLGPQSWVYKLAPLIDTTSVSGGHQNQFTLSMQPDQFSPQAKTLSAMNLESREFWTALARIIWLEITLNS